MTGRQFSTLTENRTTPNELLTMRRILDTIYRASGVLAAFFLFAIFVIVLAQVGANVINRLTAELAGGSIGVSIPSYAELAGFSLAASTCLALAYTLRAGAHIRVTLIIDSLDDRGRRFTELWCSGCGAAITGTFAYFSVRLALDSLSFGDVSPGMIPVPLWLPQSAMALGLVILAIAFIDEFIVIFGRRQPAYARGAGHEDAAVRGQ